MRGSKVVERIDDVAGATDQVTLFAACTAIGIGLLVPAATVFTPFAISGFAAAALFKTATSWIRYFTSDKTSATKLTPPTASTVAGLAAATGAIEAAVNDWTGKWVPMSPDGLFAVASGIGLGSALSDVPKALDSRLPSTDRIQAVANVAEPAGVALVAGALRSMNSHPDTSPTAAEIAIEMTGAALTIVPLAVRGMCGALKCCGVFSSNKGSSVQHSNETQPLINAPSNT